MKICPNCNATAGDDARFCVKCGFNIKKHEEENNAIFCPSCGTKFSGGMFCPQCGYNVSKDLAAANNNTDSFDNIDFSDMQTEAEKQLLEKIKERVKADSDISNGVLHKYYGNDTVVVIPDDITEIGEKAFENRNEITKVVLPNNLKVIGKSAFLCCTSLKSIIIPSGVTSIGEFAFCVCSALENVRIPHSITKIELGVFSSCSSLKKVELPLSIKEIAPSAFSCCTELKEINIPDGVTVINSYVFNWCKSLESITIPSSVVRIDDSAFRGCESLVNINVPFSVTQIGNKVFMDCKKLEKAAIFGNIKKLNDDLFKNCTNLKDVLLPQSIETVGTGVFDNCTSLEKIRIPKNMTDVLRLSFAFWGCRNLKEIIVESGNLKACSIDGCLYEYSSDGTLALYCVPEGKEYECFELPKNTVAISASAFYNAKKIASVKLNEELKIVSEYAFKECENISKIYVPAGKKYDNLPVGAEIIEY